MSEDDEIERLLNTAKDNLQNPDKGDTIDLDGVDAETADDVESISKTWKSLPQIEDELGTDGLPSRRQKNNGVTTLNISQEKPRGIRKIQDPVRVKLDKKAEEDSHAGDKWFNMPKTEVTASVKRDLQMLQLRSALDPKRHYKKDKSGPPKYFQTGTIIEGNTEFFSARLTKKERQQTLADEILADQKSQDYFKRKYHEIQLQSTSGRKKHYKKVKQMRKKF